MELQLVLEPTYSGDRDIRMIRLFVSQGFPPHVQQMSISSSTTTRKSRRDDDIYFESYRESHGSTCNCTVLIHQLATTGGTARSTLILLHEPMRSSESPQSTKSYQ